MAEKMRRNSMPEKRRRGGSESGLDLEVSLMTAERGVWAGRFEFFLSCLGYAVGLGNVWRFPTMCYKNGGGVFLVPYLLFLILGGIPLVFLELCLGQYASLGAITIWRLAPIFKGIGYGMVIASFFVGVYYNLILAWSLYYLFASMQKQLPWVTCGNVWNSPACCEKIEYLPNCTAATFNCTVCSGNISANISQTTFTLSTDTNYSGWISPVEEYFNNHVLGVSPPSLSEGLGAIQWQVALCLLAAWILVFLCLINGIKSSGKIIYVTALFPYAMLVVLLISALLLPGAKKGILFYLKPDWSKLKQAQVWHDAATQVLFSLSPCYGGLVTLASYSSFSNNCYSSRSRRDELSTIPENLQGRSFPNFSQGQCVALVTIVCLLIALRDALLVSLLNALTSIFAGFPVFATLGYMAHQLGAPVDSVVSSGPGLVFATWPTALSSVSGGPAWCVLFFLMLIFIGLDSQFVFVHTIVTAIHDELGATRLHPRTQRRLILAVLCTVMCLAGLPLCTQGGVHLFNLLDHFAPAWSVLVLGGLECVIVGWVYGYQRFSHDIWSMFGKRPGRWWRLMWQGVTPLYLVFLLVISLMQRRNPLLYHDVPLSTASQAVAWTVVGLGLLPVPAYMMYAMCRVQGSFKLRFLFLLKPSIIWGPAWETPELRGALTTLPDYMISEKEEGIPNPVLVKERSLTFSSSLDDIDSVSASEGYVPPAYDDPDNIDTGSMEWEGDENKQRGNWSGRLDFVLSGAGYCIGIGNVWRFPYLVYKNGGGAFFLPYMVMVIFCGLPIFFMEVAFGQFASTGPISVWRVSPIFKGMGYCVCLTVFFITIYYNMINAWSVYYLFASMTTQLPWATCNNTWNTEMCRLRSQFRVDNSSCSNSSNDATCSLYVQEVNSTNLTAMFLNDTATDKFRTPAEEYFFNEVISLSAGIDTVGSIRWPLALCLLFCWMLTFVALIRGVKSIGKVVYFTVTFPYLVLLILLIRYVTLDTEAHLDGIKYYVTPAWSRLTDATVWGDAASQLFFSLGLSQGGLVALASFNRFHYDCYRDAYIICLLDTLTSVFAGFVVFAILGVMAKEANMEVKDVVSSSFTLAYVVFAEAVTKLPLAWLWSVLVYFMLFCLAIDSVFIMVYGLIVGIVDEFNLHDKQIIVIATVCVISFLLGLPLTTEFILIFSWVNYSAPSLDSGYLYPPWAHGLGLILALLPILCIPITALIQVLLSLRNGCTKALIIQSKPDTEWGPALDKHRAASYLPSATASLTQTDRIQEWVEKGTFTEIFHTSSSGNLYPAPETEDVTNRSSQLSSSLATEQHDESSPMASTSTLPATDTVLTELTSETTSSDATPVKNGIQKTTLTPLARNNLRKCTSRKLMLDSPCVSPGGETNTQSFTSAQRSSGTKESLSTKRSSGAEGSSTKRSPSAKRVSNAKRSLSAQKSNSESSVTGQAIPFHLNQSKRWNMTGSTSTSPEDSVVSSIHTWSNNDSPLTGIRKRTHHTAKPRRRRKDSRVTFKEDVSDGRRLVIGSPRDPNIPTSEKSTQTLLHYWDLVGKTEIPIIQIERDCLDTLFPSSAYQLNDTITLRAEVHSGVEKSDKKSSSQKKSGQSKALSIHIEENTECGQCNSSLFTDSGTSDHSEKTIGEGDDSEKTIGEGDHSEKTIGEGDDYRTSTPYGKDRSQGALIKSYDFDDFSTDQCEFSATESGKSHSQELSMPPVDCDLSSGSLETLEDNGKSNNSQSNVSERSLPSLGHSSDILSASHHPAIVHTSSQHSHHIPSSHHCDNILPTESIRPSLQHSSDIQPSLEHSGNIQSSLENNNKIPPSIEHSSNIPSLERSGNIPPSSEASNILPGNINCQQNHTAPDILSVVSKRCVAQTLSSSSSSSSCSSQSVVELQTKTRHVSSGTDDLECTPL